MGHPIITALFLIAAGLLMFRIRGWTHRWIGFMLISAGLNIVMGISNVGGGIAYFVWIMIVFILCLVAIFEEPEKK